MKLKAIIAAVSAALIVVAAVGAVGALNFGRTEAVAPQKAHDARSDGHQIACKPARGTG